MNTQEWHKKRPNETSKQQASKQQATGTVASYATYRAKEALYYLPPSTKQQ